MFVWAAALVRMMIWLWATVLVRRSMAVRTALAAVILLAFAAATLPSLAAQGNAAEAG